MMDHPHEAADKKEDCKVDLFKFEDPLKMTFVFTIFFNCNLEGIRNC